VDLFVQVSRDQNGRLNGNVVPKDLGLPRSFSGTLELLKVLEDLVVSATGAYQASKGHPSPQGKPRRKS
jgi:hypothetical protein